MSTTRGQHLIGQEIGSCILEKLLGFGGSSAVFLAQNRLTTEKVAIKVFLPRSTMDKQMQRNFYHRFLREAQAASELDHPNILSIFSYGEHDGLPYIVMPYMPGGTLSEYVAKHGPLSLGEAQQYLEQISSALDYAHESGCVHCDVKPANLLLDGWGQVLLSDFGIVRLMQPDGNGANQVMKSSETLMGTPDYISPEQALGEPLDGRSDAYSLAVTLFFLLAGKPPFLADSSIAMALMHVHETPPTLGMMRADVTAQIDSVIAKALSKWPEERYQTAGEFSKAFAEAVANAESDIFSDSGTKRRFIGPGSGNKQVIAALKPIVQVKPILQNPVNLRRIGLPLVLLAAIITGSIVTIYSFSSFFHSHPREQVTPSTAQIDYLKDKQDEWTKSPTYFFKKGQYYIQNTAHVGISLAFYDFGNDKFTNFRLTVTATEIRGSQNGGDYYGIIFRSSSDLLHYYLFEIVGSAGGQYAFLRYDQTSWQSLAYGSVSGLSPNFGQHNVLTAEVTGNTFTFFINQKPLGEKFTDPSKQPLTSGDIGLSVEGQNTEVAFSHLQIAPL